MANKFHSKKNSMKPPPTGVSGPKSDTVNEDTASWGDLPGKSGPDRSVGVKKLKTQATSKGI